MNNTLLNNAVANFERARSLMSDEVAPGLLIKMAAPRTRTEMTLTPQLEDGRVHPVRSYIVRHSDALGPSKGGIRMTSDVTLDDVNGLAMEMT